MAGRGFGRALLGSGLLVVTLLGGAGGYGLGLLTTSEQASARTGAVPLGGITPASATPTPSLKPIVPDHTPPLLVEDLEYKTRDFEVQDVWKSAVRIKVPGNWDMTIQDPPKYVRFNEPARKRWIRIESGFTIQRAPAASMAARIAQLADIPANQRLTIVSHDVDRTTHDATLAYTYVPEQTLRYVVVRWVANKAGLCTFEIAVTGFPKDAAALADILDHAAKSATRTDSPIN